MPMNELWITTVLNLIIRPIYRLLLAQFHPLLSIGLLSFTSSFPVLCYSHSLSSDKFNNIKKFFIHVVTGTERDVGHLSSRILCKGSLGLNYFNYRCIHILFIPYLLCWTFKRHKEGSLETLCSNYAVHILTKAMLSLAFTTVVVVASNTLLMTSLISFT